jgi:hypothetical protein
VADLSDLASPLQDAEMQKCRVTTPSQDAEITVLSMGDGILTYLPFRSPEPTSPKYCRK